MVSFEVPMIATMLIPTILAGSMSMNAISGRRISGIVFLAPAGCRSYSWSRRSPNLAARHLI